MKELRITQCQVGKFNLLSSEESLSFYMGIYEDGVLITNGKNRAQLHYSGDTDVYDILDDALNMMHEVISICLKNSQQWISSNNYLGDCILFAKTYEENITELDRYIISKRKESINRQIMSLQKELSSIDGGLLCSISNETNDFLEKEISVYRKWHSLNIEKMADMIPNTPSWQSLIEKNISYEEKIKNLNDMKIIEHATI